jgi:hypothetical protein
MPRSSFPARVLAIAVTGALLLPVVLSACPLCKEEVPDNSPGMWRGMYWSILLMVAMPFAAAGTIVVLVLRARRRQAATLSAQPQAATLGAPPGASS